MVIKNPAKKIINFHNSSNLIISNLIIIVIVRLLSSGSAILFNELADAVIGFTFIEIAFIIISLNAESYVINFINNPNDKNNTKLIKKKNKAIS